MLWKWIQQERPLSESRLKTELTVFEWHVRESMYVKKRSLAA